MAGLGNPGDRYADTYHNLGYQAVDALRREWGSTSVRISADHLYETDHRPDLYLGKPDRFVNRSGSILSQWCRDLELSPAQVLVIYDDFSLDVGRIRVRPSGGPGGHNGMKDVLSSLDSEQVPRIRIGIGPIPSGDNPADFVLGEISSRDRSLFHEIFQEFPQIVDVIREQGCEAAMNRWNGVDYRE